MKTLHIKSGGLIDDKEFYEFHRMITSRAAGGANFKVDIEEVSEMNLSKFNTLVKLYVSLRRAGKKLEYFNAQESVIKYIDKTNFHHVFAY